MTIVNHSTGEVVSLDLLKSRFPTICEADNPKLGDKHRTKWVDEQSPSDAELRLIGYSKLLETPRPINALPAPNQMAADQWQQRWALMPLDDLRAKIESLIATAADAWIDRHLPPRKRERHQADFAVLNWLGDSKTPEQQARVVDLLRVLAWVDSVDAAEAAAIAALAAMDREQLDAWTMPALPEWPA